MNRYTPELSSRVIAGTVDVGGSPVYYWEYPAIPGSAETRTMLVVHGFRGDHHGLERVVEALPGLRILMPDLPGFGESPAFPDREHGIDSYADTVAGLLDALGLDRSTVLLGHSFGSIVASHFVAAHPGRVAALILVNPIAAPALEGPKGGLSKLAQFYYWAASKLPERAGQAILRSSLIVQVMSVAMAKTQDPELRRFIHAQHHAHFSSFANRTMLLESFKASISGNVRQVADRLQLPTLLVAGEKDDVTALPEQRVLLGMLPDGELQVIDGVGHLIHYETPLEAASAILSFLQAHPAEDA
ncbi:MAG: alpha/beta hydrolase [Renibacterium salmoninarum]|nr:alpha/beta hydrolase [Renibacterium salmoninarum]